MGVRSKKGGGPCYKGSATISMAGQGMVVDLSSRRGYRLDYAAVVRKLWNKCRAAKETVNNGWITRTGGDMGYPVLPQWTKHSHIHGKYKASIVFTAVCKHP